MGNDSGTDAFIKMSTYSPQRHCQGCPTMTFERIVPLLLVATVMLMAFATWVTQHRAETAPHQAAVDTHATSTPTAGQESVGLGPLPTLSPLELRPAPDEDRNPQPHTWTNDRIRIAGRVLNAYGDPIAGAAVRCGPEDAALSGWNAGHTTPNPLTDGALHPPGQPWVEPQRHEFEAVTDEGGIAVFDDLTPGGYAIELRGDGAWQPVDRRLEVREGGEPGIDVPCRPAARSRRQRGNASSDSRTNRIVEEMFLSY